MQTLQERAEREKILQGSFVSLFINATFARASQSYCNKTLCSSYGNGNNNNATLARGFFCSFCAAAGSISQAANMT
jgi:hypothetical protein